MRRAPITQNEWASAKLEVRNAFASIPDQQIFVTEPLHYEEPMYLRTDDERVPRIVSLARVVNADSPETPVTYGAVTWAYAGGTGGQVRIIDIVSMSTGTTRYMFTWKVEW